MHGVWSGTLKDASNWHLGAVACLNCDVFYYVTNNGRAPGDNKIDGSPVLRTDHDHTFWLNNTAACPIDWGDVDDPDCYLEVVASWACSNYESAAHSILVDGWFILPEYQVPSDLRV